MSSSACEEKSLFEKMKNEAENKIFNSFFRSSFVHLDTKLSKREQGFLTIPTDIMIFYTLISIFIESFDHNFN